MNYYAKWLFTNLIFVTFIGLILITGCDQEASPTGPDSNLKSSDYFYEQPVRVYYDSSGLNPLAAKVAIATKQPTEAVIRVLGDRTISYKSDLIRAEHLLPVIGLYADFANKVEIRVSNAHGDYSMDTLTIKTVKLPEVFPDINILRTDGRHMEPGMTLANMNIFDDGKLRSYSFMFNSYGDVRWMLDLTDFDGPAYQVRRFNDGNFVFAVGDEIYRVDLSGHILKEIKVPGYKFHHDLVELPNGNIIGAVSKEGENTINDHIIEVDPKSGDVEREWDLRTILDVDRQVHLGNSSNWFHMNGIAYDKTDNTLIVSGRHQGIVKINMNNELQWILAPRHGWGQAGINKNGKNTVDYLLTAIDKKGKTYDENIQLGLSGLATFDWSWGPHSPVLLPNGHLFLFDNGDKRYYKNTVKFSRAVEYEINESIKTVKQVWSYGKERGEQFFSSIVSNVQFLPETGNRLIASGFILTDNERKAIITEVSYPDGNNLFEAELNFNNDKDIQLLYRAYRMKISN